MPSNYPVGVSSRSLDYQLYGEREACPICGTLADYGEDYCDYCLTYRQDIIAELEDAERESEEAEDDDSED